MTFVLKCTLLAGNFLPFASTFVRSMSGDQGSQVLKSYVKLNVGGFLFNTTISTLTKQDCMLRAFFSGRLELRTDDEGKKCQRKPKIHTLKSFWFIVYFAGYILIDRCGKHFDKILNYLRDSNVALPESQKEIAELLAEAKYCKFFDTIFQCQ